ncbi:MAG: 4Fe-4S dicluster domain-containing protein [Legionella sp.]
MTDEVITYDVIIIGAGPAGLSTAIRLKQLAVQYNKTLSVCILEKGSNIGAHILSGAVLEPRSLKELLPDKWQEAPFDCEVTSDQFFYLTERKYYRLPTPRSLNNAGNFIMSLGDLCVFLAAQAEQLGCEIYPGFAATKMLYNNDGAVIGVSTGPVGLTKDGEESAHYQPGMLLYAQQTIVAEGCRGQLSQEVIKKFQLNTHSNPQTYGLGIKELWHIKPDNHQPGKVFHTIGWPLDHATYGGSFVYHYTDNIVAIGFVIGLDYQNTWLNPHAEMQRFKNHPLIRTILHEGERVAYGAKSLCEGGWQSLPKLTFPGGMLVGDSAGFLNVAKLKGIHTAIKSGILAANECFKALNEQTSAIEITNYNQQIKESWLGNELYRVRNIRPGFNHGLFWGLANAAFETYISRGYSPWTLNNHADYNRLKPAHLTKKIHYPKVDDQLTFDRLSSVFLSNTFHDENQPCHLQLLKPRLAIDVNYNIYNSPETRYCPANVYEIITNAGKPYLQINAQNCIHCKTCDIKDPKQNIIWTAPEAGNGPNYVRM